MTTSDTLVKRLKAVARAHQGRPVQLVKDGNGKFQSVSYREFWERVTTLGAGLKALGVGRGHHVGLISDNRAEWPVADAAIMGLGAVDVPRGSDSTKEEIAYILKHSDSTVAFCENKALLEIILAGLEPKSALRTIIVMDNSLGGTRKAPASVQVLNWHEVMVKGRAELNRQSDFFDLEVERGRSGDPATIIYTSGTTGEPKGVILTHQSFLFQLDRIHQILDVDETDVCLSVLPIWHVFERLVEYVIFTKGAAVGYSKPVGRVLMEDMAALNPTYLPSVPRIWEGVRTAVYRNVRAQNPVKRGLFHLFLAVSVLWCDLRDRFLDRWPRFSAHWNLPTQLWTALPLLLLWPVKLLGELLVFRPIRRKLGTRFQAGISGGGALPAYIDRFFRGLGIPVLEGYGLTECAPVLALRLQKAPVPFTVGPLLADIDFKVVGENGQTLGPGEKGTLHVKTPQVMQGYYKRPEATAQVLQDGWLNTGDLVRLTHRGEVQIVGRSKDTIVLTGGENVEPEPIETRLLQSEFIDQVMVVGQDQRFLGALIVPNFELLDRFAASRQLDFLDREELLEHQVVREYVHEIIQHLVNQRTGFKAFERVYRFALLPQAFVPQIEVTASLKLKRNVIAERHAAVIARLYAHGDGEH